jgi:hypothetical protein
MTNKKTDVFGRAAHAKRWQDPLVRRVGAVPAGCPPSVGLFKFGTPQAQYVPKPFFNANVIFVSDLILADHVSPNEFARQFPLKRPGSNPSRVVMNSGTDMHVHSSSVELYLLLPRALNIFERQHEFISRDNRLYVVFA